MHKDLSEQLRAIATATNPSVTVDAVTVPASLLLTVAEALDAA